MFDQTPKPSTLTAKGFYVWLNICRLSELQLFADAHYDGLLVLPHYNFFQFVHLKKSIFQYLVIVLERIISSFVKSTTHLFAGKRKA